MRTKANHKETRQKLAKEREEARANRTDKQQLSRLDEMFGKNKGATKERTRLTKGEQTTQ